jgi:hypothetical protein
MSGPSLIALYQPAQRLTRHCEERSEAIQTMLANPGLLRFARNDGSSQQVIGEGEKKASRSF